MKHTHLVVDYANPQNLNDVISVEYRLRDYPIVSRWVQHVIAATKRFPIDDPERFYGFNDIEVEKQRAIDQINHNVDVINQYCSVADRKLSSVYDQDTLNYLHNIFEIYHGLLDRQDSEYWYTAPQKVRDALADLNVCVHRCEHIALGNHPRHVVTWYGLPKTQVLADSDYQHFTPGYNTRTVYLNYVEIGKTFEDLADDSDLYISAEAFRPFRHFGADFNIKFYTTSAEELANRRERMLKYYTNNQSFFEQRGLTLDHPYMKPGSIPLADADSNFNYLSLSNHLYVKKVSFK